jgi:hypothetical protein
MTASIIIIGILALLLIYVTYYYTNQEYYLAQIVQTTSGYDYHTYHYFFDVQYIKPSSGGIGGTVLKMKRIEVPYAAYQDLKAGDKIVIKA